MTRDRLVALPDGEDLIPGLKGMGVGGAGGGEVVNTVSEIMKDGEECSKLESPLNNNNNNNNNNNDNNDDDDANTNANANANEQTQAHPSSTDTNVFATDNRHLTDDNTSQSLTQRHLTQLQKTQTPGSHIIAALISNSATFASKTAFSQAKYISRKQLKYMPRCRIVRITPSSLCSAMFLKDARRISNLREDTLGAILTYSNICAGSRVMVMDTAVQGLISASCAHKMGGYGSIISLFVGQQPSYLDVVHKMNLGLKGRDMIKWVQVGEVFGDYEEKGRQMERLKELLRQRAIKNDEDGDGDGNTANVEGEKEVVLDVEKRDRENISWPPPLQSHTREYILRDMKTERQIVNFLDRRSARFARKLTRHSMLELREIVDSCRDDEKEENELSFVENGTGDDGNSKMEVDETDESNVGDNGEGNGSKEEAAPSVPPVVQPDKNPTTPPLRQCDSLIIATKYNPTTTLLRLLPYLAPSCPFVIYHEFLEPLLDTFRHLQNISATTTATSDIASRECSQDINTRKNVAINLRLTDVWFREYQVLEGRTHPNMNMSQNGGYLLMGTKLCPRTGTNELNEERMKELRAKMGSRRTNKANKKRKNETTATANGAGTNVEYKRAKNLDEK